MTTAGPARDRPVLAGPVTEARALLRGVRSILSAGDLAGAAATLTFFSGIALVGWLLLAVWSTTWWSGAEAAAEHLERLRVLVPDDMGARTPYDALVAAGTGMGAWSALVLLFPVSFYGEGLRRAALSLQVASPVTDAPEEERFTGWRSRLAVMPLLLVLPLLAWAWFAVGDLLVPLSPEGGGGSVTDYLVRIGVGFFATALVLAAALTWVLAVVVPRPPRPWVSGVVGLLGGSCVAGFLQGFWLFLAIPIDVGVPYAGLGVVGGVVAVGLWLYVLHVVVLTTWSAAAALETRLQQAGPQPRPAAGEAT